MISLPTSIKNNISDHYGIFEIEPFILDMELLLEML